MLIHGWFFWFEQGRLLNFENLQVLYIAISRFHLKRTGTREIPFFGIYIGI